MKKANKKINARKIILLICILIIIIYVIKNPIKIENEIKDIVPTGGTDDTLYSIIKQDYNNKYKGIGQKKIENKDGYFTTFTTVEENKKVYKEYKQNGTALWSNNKYWDGTMEDNGCSITAISIILSGYNKNYTPEDLRKKYYPKLDGNDIPKVLENTYKIKNSDFLYNNQYLSSDYITKHLLTNRPVLVCVWNKPNENRWTTASHYIVLLATDGENMVYVSNPNGLDNTYKSSGWYEIGEITPYIAKALFIESYK